jgi:class 3 adenylate cyclase
VWQIIVNGPGRVDDTFSVGGAGAVVGREKANELVLTGEPVSRRHGRFELRGETLCFEDLGSRNGTKLNGQRIKGRVSLKPTDTLSIGAFALRVRRMARLENLELSLAQLDAGGVRRFRMDDVRGHVLLSRARRDRDLAQEIEELSAGEWVEGRARPAFGTLILHLDQVEQVANAEQAQKLLEDVLDWMLDKVEADSGTLLLRHRDGLMVPVVVRGRAKGPVPLCDDVLAATLKSRKAVAFSGITEPLAGKSTPPQQVLCASIGSGEAPLGALYLNRPDREEEVAPYLDLANAIAYLSERAIARYGVHRRAERQDRTAALLKRHHAPDLVRARLQDAARAGVELAPKLEKKELAVLVAELHGFHHKAERLAPDRLTSLLADFYPCAMGVLLSFEATVDKLGDGGVRAYFGAPVSHEDDAERLVQAALALRIEWNRLIAKRPPPERFGLRVGLGFGTALVGIVGAPVRYDFTALGEAVEAAQALCAAAEPGQIVLTQKLKRAAAGLVTVASPGGAQASLPGGKSLPFLVLADQDTATTGLTHRVPRLHDPD